MENEIWKDIPNYEGIYQVSSLGNVKSLNYNHTKKEKHLKKVLMPSDYYVVCLMAKSKRKNFFIHQLVAISFLGHIPNGNTLVIDHINDNKLDNRLENLQVVTNRFNSHKTQGNYSSNYKGVNWHKASKKWASQIKINKKTIHLGLFKCELAAHIAYINKLKNYEKMFHV
jgi:hypothetical protein